MRPRAVKGNYMNRDEHIKVIVGEECNEVAHRMSKALRFGLDQIQPGQPLTNRERVQEEFAHLVAVLEMIDPALTFVTPMQVSAKRERVEKYLRFAAECGTLTADVKSEAYAQFLAHILSHGLCHAEHCGDDPTLDAQARQAFIDAHQDICTCGAEKVLALAEEIGELT